MQKGAVVPSSGLGKWHHRALSHWALCGETSSCSHGHAPTSRRPTNQMRTVLRSSRSGWRHCLCEVYGTVKQPSLSLSDVHLLLGESRQVASDLGGGLICPEPPAPPRTSQRERFRKWGRWSALAFQLKNISAHITSALATMGWKDSILRLFLLCFQEKEPCLAIPMSHQCIAFLSPPTKVDCHRKELNSLSNPVKITTCPFNRRVEKT